MLQKRGENKLPPGVAASLTVLLILLFIILYFILLPASERNKLLEINDTDDGDDGIDDSDSGRDVLLSKVPGQVYAYNEYDIVKKMSSINLFSRVESSIFDLSDKVIISKSLFTSKEKTFNFPAEENTEEVLLYFFVDKSKGTLTVEVNGNVVYEGEVETSEIPISIPISSLKRSNQLVLKVGSFGLLSHYYELSDVKIVNKVRTEQKVSTRSFVVSSTEAENLKEAQLDYYIYCNDADNVGDMEITLNDNVLFPYDRVFCESNSPALDIPTDYISKGTNILEFNIDKGDFRVEQLQVTIRLKEKFFPKYEYDVDEELYDSVLDGDKDIKLGMKMGDGTKKATIWLSADGKNLYMNTDEDEYIIDISDYVEQGQNLIQVIPKNNFNIESLKIWAE